MKIYANFYFQGTREPEAPRLKVLFWCGLAKLVAAAVSKTAYFWVRVPGPPPIPNPKLCSFGFNVYKGVPRGLKTVINSVVSWTVNARTNIVQQIPITAPLSGGSNPRVDPARRVNSSAWMSKRKIIIADTTFGNTTKVYAGSWCNGNTFGFDPTVLRSSRGEPANLR